jgi:hypothetical protein
VDRLLHGDQQKALLEAQRKWFGNQYQAGDGDKPYNHLLYPGGSPLGEAFAQISQALLQPLMEHLEWDD